MVSIPIVIKIRLIGVYVIVTDPKVGPLNYNVNQLQFKYESITINPNYIFGQFE